MTALRPRSAAAPRPDAAGDVPLLRVTGLAKSYETDAGLVPAIAHVDLSLRAGEFLSIVGPSGCGKTTLLGCIGGLIPITAGTVAIHGVPITDPPRNLSVVFQDYSRSLFPWLTVAKNVALPMRGRSTDKAILRADVRELLGQVGLDDAVARRYPWQLSGGMQQRVAIARALIPRPEILLMDEPFASVDAQTRAGLEDLVLRLWAEWRKTVLFVTHDIDEAVYLSDRVVVLSPAPARNVAEVDIPLPRPRSQIETREDPRFGKLHGELYRLIVAAAEARMGSGR